MIATTENTAVTAAAKIHTSTRRRTNPRSPARSKTRQPSSPRYTTPTHLPTLDTGFTDTKQDARQLAPMFEAENPGIDLKFVTLSENEARAKITASTVRAATRGTAA